MNVTLALTASLAALAVGQIAAPAFAQDANAPTPATVPAAAAASDSSPDGSGLGEIVVTATKRETNLQKTPIAISVVSSATIKDRHIQSLLDLADGGIPSLRVSRR